jgi:methanogenic corrinoid protein MtbC1
MNELFPEIMSMERKNKKIVISCVENEEHQVGGKMVADIFEKNSWDAHYLGANTPMDELLRFCELVKPDLICLSLSVYLNVQFLLKEIRGIREVSNIPIIIGGQALIKVGVELSEKFKDVFYFENLESVEKYIKGCD